MPHPQPIDRLLTRLTVQLCAGPLSALALYGPAGSGKSHLAAALARHPAIRQHFAGGILWAGLGANADGVTPLNLWAEQLGVDVSGHPTPAARRQALRQAIGARRLFIVIDDACTLEAAEGLRCGGPGSVHLLTTRDERLAQAFAGESHAVQLRPLKPEPACVLVQGLAPVEDLAAPRWFGRCLGFRRWMNGAHRCGWERGEIVVRGDISYQLEYTLTDGPQQDAQDALPGHTRFRTQSPFTQSPNGVDPCL
jgi:hypothetical protein